jgi:hypothetical protein
MDALDFEGRQRLIRLVLEGVRASGHRVELRLRIPLDEHPQAGSPDDLLTCGLAGKGTSSSNEGLRSLGHDEALTQREDGELLAI